MKRPHDRLKEKPRRSGVSLRETSTLRPITGGSIILKDPSVMIPVPIRRVVFRRAFEFLIADVQLVAAEPFVIFQPRPRNGVMIVTNAEETGKAHHLSRPLSLSLGGAARRAPRRTPPADMHPRSAPVGRAELSDGAVVRWPPAVAHSGTGSLGIFWRNALRQKGKWGRR
jgi:hypothetical protein